MRLIIISVTGFFVGSLFVVYGGLLAWRPDLFLKFHDTFIDRGQWNRNAAWRKNVSSVEYKLLGIAFCAFGVFIIFVLLAK